MSLYYSFEAEIENVYAEIEENLKFTKQLHLEEQHKHDVEKKNGSWFYPRSDWYTLYWDGSSADKVARRALLKAEAKEEVMVKRMEARAKERAEAEARQKAAEAKQKARLAKQIQKQREVLDKFPALDKFARSFCGVRISRTLVRSSRYELVMKRLYEPGGAGYERALGEYKGALAQVEEKSFLSGID